jgi:ParB-like chromosome segregation protein Spo0J
MNTPASVDPKSTPPVAPALVQESLPIKAGAEGVLTLDAIDIDPAWNTRSPANVESWFMSENDPDSSGLEGLTRNMRAHGQLTPVDIREIDEKHYRWGKTDKRYSLVCGFRRAAALRLIYKDVLRPRQLGEEASTLIPGLELHQVRVRNHGPLDEERSFSINASENGPRDGLTPPELVALAIRARDDFTMSAEKIAIMVGKQTRVVRDYMRVATLPKPVLDHWMNGGEYEGIINSNRANISSLMVIVKMTPKEQWAEEYKKLISYKKETHDDRTSYVQRLLIQADNIGAILGRLERKGVILISRPEWADHLDLLLNLKEQRMSYSTTKRIANRVTEAYERTRQSIPVIESTESTEG